LGNIFIFLIIERSEQRSKGEDVRRQEQLNSLALQLKNESDQKAVIVEQLQQKLAVEDMRRKQLNSSLEKEKENNMRLYEQYLKTLKDLQSLQTQQVNCAKALKISKTCRLRGLVVYHINM